MNRLMSVSDVLAETRALLAKVRRTIVVVTRQLRREIRSAEEQRTRVRVLPLERVALSPQIPDRWFALCFGLVEAEKQQGLSQSPCSRNEVL